MEDKQKIGTFIIIAVVVISLLIAVTTNTQQGQRLSNINNETVTLSSVGASTGELTNDDLTTIPTLRNETSESLLGFCNVTLLTGDLDCNSTGSLTCYADYTYYPDTYVKETSSRTLIILISLILVIAVVIGFYHKLIKKE